MGTLLSWMPYIMQGLSLLTSVAMRSNQSSATSSQRAGEETSSGSETTTGSLTAPQQIGSTQIGTPTGITTYNNQGSVNMANGMSFLSSIISNLMNAGSQASAKKYNSAEAAAERAFAKEMRGTAYQDTVKDMIAAGINPILAANNGATATPSGASASIGTQHYNQQSAQAAAVSAMYEYGNNTAELANRYLELAKKSTSAKQYHSAKSFNEAASSLAQSSAKQVSNYNYAANNLLDELGDAGDKLRDAGEKAAESAKGAGRKAASAFKDRWEKGRKNITPYMSVNPNQIMGAYRGD
nr:MAG TPA: minor capsid protein [Microviridae sp.]